MIMAPTDTDPVIRGCQGFLTTLSVLPFIHPAFLHLLTAHTPLAHPSPLHPPIVTRFLNRVNAALQDKGNETDRAVGWKAASLIVDQDEEGYTLQNFGKGWITTCLGSLTVWVDYSSLIPY